VELSKTDLAVLSGRGQGMLKTMPVLLPMAHLENNEKTSE